MKKIMWIVAMIPVVVTSVVLQFMPDIIPMHHDLEGNTDRWGSKTESFIFPVIILLRHLVDMFTVSGGKNTPHPETVCVMQSVLPQSGVKRIVNNSPIYTARKIIEEDFALL